MNEQRRKTMSEGEDQSDNDTDADELEHYDDEE
jgi:hypothetical protein